MRQLFLLLTIFCISILTTTAQVVNDKQWSLVNKRTADWCPFCGTWGWDMKTKIHENFDSENVIIMANHHSGGLSNSTSSEFSANFEGGGQPIFYLDGADLNVSSSNTSARIQDIKLVVDFNKLTAPYAGVGLEASLSQTNQNTLDVKAKVTFLQATEGGDYYMGLYLLEDIIHMQASRTSSELHKNVLTKSLLPKTFANPIINGAVAVGTTFDFAASVSNVNADRDKLKVVGIIWTKVNGRYLFFNANQIDVAIPASLKTVENISEVQIYQSSPENIVLDLSLTNAMENTTIQLVNLAGQVISTQHVNHLNTGKNEISINAPLTSGVYLVNIQNDNSIMSKKVIISR